MKNFKKAEKIVADYRKLRLNPKEKNNFNIHKKLIEAGYNSMSDLENDINEDYIISSKIKIKEINTDILLEEIKKSIGTNTLLLVKPKKTCVYNGNKDFNYLYCKENNIPIYELGYMGGTIVASKEDLGIIFILDRSELLGFIQQKIAYIIYEIFKKTDIIGNDILIDGNKVSGSGYKKIDNSYLYYYQVSFNSDVEIIKNVCTKEIKKIPKGLNNFGDKDREYFCNKMKEWLQQL